MSNRFQSKPEQYRISEGERIENAVLTALRSYITEHHVGRTPGAAKNYLPDFCVTDAETKEVLFYIESKSCTTQCCSFTISRERIYNGSDTWRDSQPPYHGTPYYTAMHDAYFISVHCGICEKIWLVDTEIYLNVFGDPTPTQWRKGSIKNENYWQPYVWFNLAELETHNIAWLL